MGNSGVRNPYRNAVIAGMIAVIGFTLFGFGVHADETSPMAGWGGFGLLAGLLGLPMFVNFLWAARIIRAMRGGRTAIAHWRLSPDDFARWLEIDRRFTERGEPNDYRVPRRLPVGSLEVIFSDDGVLIGGDYFGLATSGLNRITSVRLIASDPPMIEFGTAAKAASNLSRLRIWTIRGILRVPVASTAAAQGNSVLQQYQAILGGRMIVKPHFWTRRIRGGLIVATVSAFLAALGFIIAWSDPERFAGSVALVVLAVGGTVFAIGGLLVALGAWLQYRRQHYG